MKRKLTIILLGALVAIALTLGSCTAGVSVTERLEQFLTDLNGDRADIYLNFHSTQTADYSAIQNPTPPPDWDALFPLASRPFSYQNLDTSNTDNVTANVIGTVYNKPVVFKMQMEGLDWKIEELTVDGILEIQ
jgi:hypothetical protein